MDPHMEKCAQYAHIAYMWLPLFLGVIAGLCLLVLTLRRALTSGAAAALAALGGVVVLGTGLLALAPHGMARGHGGGAGGGPAANDDLHRKLQEVTTEVDQLHSELRRIRAAAPMPAGVRPLPRIVGPAPAPAAPSETPRPPAGDQPRTPSSDSPSPAPPSQPPPSGNPLGGPETPPPPAEPTAPEPERSPR